MGGKIDIVKGRIKEATGALANNDELRQKGKMDQAVGHGKVEVDKVVDRAAKRKKKLEK